MEWLVNFCTIVCWPASQNGLLTAMYFIKDNLVRPANSLVADELIPINNPKLMHSLEAVGCDKLRLTGVDSAVP